MANGVVYRNLLAAAGDLQTAAAVRMDLAAVDVDIRGGIHPNANPLLWRSHSRMVTSCAPARTKIPSWKPPRISKPSTTTYAVPPRTSKAERLAAGYCRIGALENRAAAGLVRDQRPGGTRCAQDDHSLYTPGWAMTVSPGLTTDAA